MNCFLIIMILIFQNIFADSHEELFAGKVRDITEEPAMMRLYEIFQREKVFSAEFTQKTFVKALNKQLVSKGKLIFVQGKGIVWETCSPFAQCLYITKDGEVFEKDNPVPVGVFRYAGLMTELIDSGSKKLSNAFEVYFSEDGPRWFLGLKPKKRIIGKFIKNMVITGDQNGKINELSIMGNDIKITEISFENHQIPLAEELNGVHEVFNKK